MSSDAATATEHEELVGELVGKLLADNPPERTDPAAFLGAQFDLGLAWVWFPEGRGGLGLPQKLQTMIDRAVSHANGPKSFPMNPIGWGMGAPTVVAHGSESQQERYLRPLFTGEEIWCQLFSEPGAGSDVAGLSSMAVRDGDEWIVNGQKVWTTLAHLARWGMLLARTDPDQPKHKGLTYFVVDMHAPGVEVRPLRQMTGDAEFNEVYFSDVRIPDAERLGAEGDGWKVAITTLMNERVALGGGAAPRNPFIAEAVETWQKRGCDDPVLRDRLSDLYIRAEVSRFTALRARAMRMSGTPGPEGSIGKLYSAELNQEIHTFIVDMLGPEGVLYPKPYGEVTTESSGPQQNFLRAQANTIEGGTSNIMRNILGERVLDLPGDMRADKGPWKDIPRS
ncbi:MAG: acyl-CoA dehydrogenase [Actinobacteria bacterium ATB1]|nr:acyl-CoA dehydrogenase [Actinobacteria bacterium ATB1]